MTGNIRETQNTLRYMYYDICITICILQSTYYNLHITITILLHRRGDTTRPYWMYLGGAVEFRDDHSVRRADRSLPLTLTCGYAYPAEALGLLADD